MAVFDLSDLSISLPAQIVVDFSLLLALRPGDDKPLSENNLTREIPERHKEP